VEDVEGTIARPEFPNRSIKLDTLTQKERSARMSRVRGRDTQPEVVVRRLLRDMGYHYRLHRKDLPGKPDIVFGKRRKVVFIHGCFWHRHPDPECRLARLPKSRLDFWLPKLTANAERDARHRKALLEIGWQVLVVWECELRHSEQLKNKLRHFLEGT
jgi:DNA mismatch endonuclease (patch repair protein)